MLRRSDFKVTAVVVDELLIDVEEGDTTATRHAIAFDLGTTTVVATLLDLSTGTPAAVHSMLNEQQPHGADVISRISATMLDPDVLPRLQQLAHETLDTLVGDVCSRGRRRPRAGLRGGAGRQRDDDRPGARDRPRAAGRRAVRADGRVRTAGLPASDLGVSVHPAAPALVFPSLGAYVGGDIVAGMLASGVDRDKRLRLFIDVGTNCEIVLGDGERILATAAPAGPAFEGGSIRCGMRAAPGAIEAVKVGDDDVVCQVIGDDGSGRWPRWGCAAPAWSTRSPSSSGSASSTPADASRPTSRRPRRCPDWPTGSPASATSGCSCWPGAASPATSSQSVQVSQRDVRELQFAKAAIATGWSLLLEEMGVEPADVQQVLLAGSFGSYLSPGNAVRIGLVPKLPVLRIVSAGNVAGEGAKMVLLSANERAGADTLLREVRYVELSDRTDFNDRFVDELSFPG